VWRFKRRNGLELLNSGHPCLVRGGPIFWLTLVNRKVFAGGACAILLVNDRLIKRARINTHLPPVIRCRLKVLCQFTSRSDGRCKWSTYSREIGRSWLPRCWHVF